MPSTILDDLLLDTAQCADAFGCTVQFLEKLRVNGRGPEFVRIGRLIRYRRSAIEKWLDAQRSTKTSGLRRRQSDRACVDARR